jgi:hypothetical protein
MGGQKKKRKEKEGREKVRREKEARELLKYVGERERERERNEILNERL